MKEYKYTHVWSLTEDFDEDSEAGESTVDDNIKTVMDLAVRLAKTADTLNQMEKDGLVLHGVRNGLFRMMTDDPKLAKKYEMITTEEFEGDNDGHSEACECPICCLEANAARTMNRMDKIELALVNAGLGSWCAGCEDFIPAGEECVDEENVPLANVLPMPKKDMN